MPSRSPNRHRREKSVLLGSMHRFFNRDTNFVDIVVVVVVVVDFHNCLPESRACAMGAVM